MYNFGLFEIKELSRTKPENLSVFLAILQLTH